MAWREVVFPQARHGIAGDAMIRELLDGEPLAVYTVWPDGALSFHVFVDSDSDSEALVVAASAYYEHFAEHGEPKPHADFTRGEK